MLLVVGFAGVGAAFLPAAENSAQKDPSSPILQGAQIFQAPNGAKYVPPDDDGSVAKTHVRMDGPEFWAIRSDLSRAVQRATTLTTFKGVSAARLKETGGNFTATEGMALFRSDGQWFRKAAIDVPAEAAQRIRALLFAAVRPRAKEKPDDDPLFHADVRLKWEGGGPLSDTEALVSFATREAKIYSATGSLYGEMSEEDISQLQTLLVLQLQVFEFQPAKEVPFQQTRF